MTPFSAMPFGRNLAIFAIVFCVLINGTWATVKLTSDYLLAQNATATARNWGQYLVASVNDLEQIAAGEQPSTASMAFFGATQKSREVFRYEIFSREGYSQVVSDRGEITLVDLSDYSDDAARSIALGEPVVDVNKGRVPNRPAFFARAYVPVLVDGRAIAVVAAYVDQTVQRDNFFHTFLLAALVLCLLTGFSFGVPVLAWYQRAKEKQQADQRIRFLANHDGLTGLTNRRYLSEKLERALAVLPVQGGSLAVHFIDLDRFKEVNDTLGHDAGDFLLKTASTRLRAVVREGDVVARQGGDEFVVLQTGVTDRVQAEKFAQRIVSALTAPVQFKEHEIRATVSIGIALAPEDGDAPERLLKSADLAMYKAKAEGRDCIRFFLPEMDVQLRARLELERAVRLAVLHERFELDYQPLFEMSGRRLSGFEALIRLRTESGTLIPPLVFIPVAEDLRLIDKIGAWVLREACRTAATWPDHLTVAVNLSPAQFAASSISDIVAAALQESGLAAQRLELEITESLLLGNSDATMTELQKLKAMGVAIVMDDFGTGYSSLSYLWRFPFDKIKIDRSFMQAFDGADRDAETVVKTIIALGRELNMRVTVEGVETAKQAAFLDQTDSDQGQGFFFGRPIPASDVGAVILADFQKSMPTPAATPQEAKLRLVSDR